MVERTTLSIDYLTQRFARVFEPPQADILAEVITEAYTDLVKTSDFNELKEIVRELAGAQQRTEARVAELAEAQQRTEARVAELAEAQQQTQRDLRQLTQTMAQLAQGLSNTRSDLAGLSRSFGYALENEAYRVLPALLADRYHIHLKHRIVRVYVGDREINLLAEGEQDGQAVVIVGEAKSQLGTDDLQQLRESVAVVQAAQQAGEIPSGRIVPLVVTHMARPAALRRAEEQGIIVVQSFEW